MGYLNTTLIKKATMYAENAGNVGSYTGGSYTGTTPASSGAGMSGSGFTGATPASSGSIAPSHASAPAPATKPINYARRTWNSARSLGRNAMGMGRQGFNAMKMLARNNPKIAALLAIGGTLAGGSLLAGAANSGRPVVRQFDASNPYAGFTTTY